MPTPKITITPAQGLLIVINSRRNELRRMNMSNIMTDKLYFNLVKLFVEGGDENTIRHYLSVLPSANYEVTYDYHAISEDPCKRYFESMYSFYILRGNILKLDEIYLYQILHLLEALAESYTVTENMIAMLTGKPEEVYGTPESVEYADLIKCLRNGEYFGWFSEMQLDRLDLMMKIHLMSLVMTCSNNSVFPLDVRHTGFFSAKHRGRIDKRDQEEVGSLNLGLMKSYMPLSPADLLRRKTPSINLRPADKSNFIPESSWVKMVAPLNVHPFSCSISGSLLGSLRCFNFFEVVIPERCYFFDDFERSSLYFKLVISCLVYFSGGHSIYEFCATLRIPEIQRAFAHCDRFSALTLSNLFGPDHNVRAFECAIDDTIVYTRRYLDYKRVLVQLHERIIPCHHTTTARAELRLSDRAREALLEMFVSSAATYQDRVAGQWFGRWRKGQQKNQLIQSFFGQAARRVALRDPESACSILESLLNTIKTDFHEGDNADAFSIRMIDSMLTRLNAVITESVYYPPTMSAYSGSLFAR